MKIWIAFAIHSLAFAVATAICASRDDYGFAVAACIGAVAQATMAIVSRHMVISREKWGAS